MSLPHVELSSSLLLHQAEIRFQSGRWVDHFVVIHLGLPKIIGAREVDLH